MNIFDGNIYIFGESIVSVFKLAIDLRNMYKTDFFSDYKMFAMRLKLGTERNKEWRCCLCLHVRTATILFGLWHLVSISNIVIKLFCFTKEFFQFPFLKIYSFNDSGLSLSTYINEFMLFYYIRMSHFFNYSTYQYIEITKAIIH